MNSCGSDCGVAIETSGDIAVIGDSSPGEGMVEEMERLRPRCDPAEYEVA